MKEIATTEPKISMEALEVCKLYLENWSVADTAKALGIPIAQVETFLHKPEVKRYIDTIFLEQGYLNRFKISKAFEDIIEKKLEEMEEADMGSSKDIADLLHMAHKMRMDELKNMQPDTVNQKNVQINNYGDNYNSLIDHLKKKD